MRTEKPSPRGKEAPRSEAQRGGRGIVMKLGQYYFLLLAKSDEMFAYPTFTRVPLPPTAHACGIPPSPEGTAFLARTRIIWMPAMSFP